MKCNILLLSFLLFASFGRTQCNKTEKTGIQNKFDKKVTTAFSYKNSIEKKYFIRTTFFNKEGKEKTIIFQHSNNEFRKEKSSRIYDSSGKLLKELRRNEQGKIEDSLIYFYDSLGNNSEKRYYRSGSLDSYTIFKYDSNCNQTDYIVYMSDSTLWIHYKDEYDENNNLIASTNVSHGGETTSYELDENGEVLSKTKMDKNGKVLSVHKREILQFKNSKPTIVVWKNRQSEITQKEEYQYKKGTLKEKKVYKNQMLILKENFDKRGNLILKITYKNGEPSWKEKHEYI